MKNTKVDQGKCIGCGSCTALAPKSFKMSDDGKTQPINPPGDDEAAVQNAIDGCPVEAIAWIEGEK